jgi:hypothetical protein
MWEKKLLQWKRKRGRAEGSSTAVMWQLCLGNIEHVQLSLAVLPMLHKCRPVLQNVLPINIEPNRLAFPRLSYSTYAFQLQRHRQ